MLDEFSFLETKGGDFHQGTNLTLRYFKYLSQIFLGSLPPYGSLFTRTLCIWPSQKWFFLWVFGLRVAEATGWDTSSIHVALLGDLFHGRTVHSKVDGLRTAVETSENLLFDMIKACVTQQCHRCCHFLRLKGLCIILPDSL